MKKIIIVTLKTIIPMGLGVFLFVYFFQKMSPKVQDAFYDALGRANYFWLILSMLLGWLAIVSRAERWRIVLEPLGFSSKLKNRYHSVIIGYLVNLTIPRAGEASRSGILLRTEKTPFAESFGTIIAERIIDLLMLSLVLIITIIFGADDFWKIKKEIELSFQKNSSGESAVLIKYIFTAIIFAGILMLIVSKNLRNKVIHLFKKFASGVFSVFKTKQPGIYIAHTLFIWTVYILVFYLPILSLPELQSLPLEAIFIGFIASSLGVSLTNGGIGIVPLLIGLVVNHFLSNQFGEKAEALGYALGMLIWGSQTLVVILGGLISLIFVSIKNKNEHELTEN